jgi:hypothetical protein
MPKPAADVTAVKREREEDFNRKDKKTQNEYDESPRTR